MISVVAFYKCGSSPSQNEKDLKNNAGDVIEQQANSNVAVQEVKEAETEVKAKAKNAEATRKVAREAVKAAEEKKNDRKGDVTYVDANRARCKAYPGDKECQ